MPYEIFKRIAEVEFSGIVKDVIGMDYKLRIILIDESYVDLFLSQKIPDKFALHWECRDPKRSIYRFDNIPDKNWQKIKTYPFHFHKGNQDKVVASPFPVDLIDGFRKFMEFIRDRLSLRAE